VPGGFVFALKGSRFITHNKKLQQIEAPLANFFASGPLRLEEKLGPVLWQFPRTARFDEQRFRRFFELLPRNTEEAAALGRRHDRRLRWQAWMRTRRRRRIRHVVEVRNESFFVPEFVRLLRRYNIALVFSDAADWPYVEELTAGIVYLRLHGSRRTYASRYTDPELDRWAERIRAGRRGGEPAPAPPPAPPAAPRRGAHPGQPLADGGHRTPRCHPRQRRLQRQPRIDAGGADHLGRARPGPPVHRGARPHGGARR
jgi:uncharacterized protein YecE (DUF72 family)